MIVWCDYCIEEGATVEIVLESGIVLQVHEVCIFPCILENASKEDPVHSVTPLDTKE